MAERSRPLWEAAGLQPDPYAGIYRGVYLDPRPPVLRGPETTPAAHSTPRSARRSPGIRRRHHPRGRTRLGSAPVIYVSLGTAPLFNQPEKFAPLLAGLNGEAVEVVMTVGDLNDPAAFGELPPTVHVEKWLALSPLLPRCDAVLCHAGSGTTLAALAAGLPLVLVPQGADQFDNARACERAGAARVLMPDQVTPAGVRDAVQAVLRDDSSERAAARTLAAEIACMPTATQVVNDLTSIADRSGTTA